MPSELPQIGPGVDTRRGPSSLREAQEPQVGPGWPAGVGRSATFLLTPPDVEGSIGQFPWGGRGNALAQSVVGNWGWLETCFSFPLTHLFSLNWLPRSVQAANLDSNKAPWRGRGTCFNFPPAPMFGREWGSSGRAPSTGGKLWLRIGEATN
eukprot:1302270-Amphidinium_carterae.1